MEEATLKIEGARFVLTVDPRRRIIRDGTVVVRGSRIAKVGKASELAEVPADRVIDAREMVVTPGLINCHMHISYAHAVRGVFPDDLGGEYLPNVFRLQGEMTPEEEYHTSLLAITELLRYGTTCFLDPGSTKHLDACLKAYEESGCRIVVGTHVVDLPNGVNVPVSTTADAIAAMERTVREYDGALGGRVRAWTMPLSADEASTELMKAAKEIADSRGTGMTLHLTNAPASVKAHLDRYGKRPVQRLEEIGVLGPNLLLAHAVGLDDAEVDCLARTGTKVVMCPTAAVKNGMGTTAKGKLPEMLERGVCVGLGVDAPNASNVVEVMRSMYLAAVLYKDARQDVSQVPAEKALEMATIDGAEALGLRDEIGSVEEGKKADLVLFDTRRPEWRSIFNPVNNLVYNADGRSVHTVVVDGRVVVEGGRPNFVDEWELIQRVQAVGEDLLARTGTSFPQRWPIE